MQIKDTKDVIDIAKDIKNLTIKRKTQQEKVW